MVKFIGALIAVLAAAFLGAVSGYDLFASWMARLRGRGPVGIFLADTILSSELRVFLFIVAIILIGWGIRDNLRLRKYVDPKKLAEHERRQWHETPEYDLTNDPGVSHSSHAPEAAAPIQAVTPPNPIFTQAEPSELMELARQGRTTAEGQRLLKPHLGTWLRVAGSMHNVHEPAGQVCLSLRVVNKKSGRLEGVAAFGSSEEWKARALVLNPGDHVNIEGQINAVTPHSVSLKRARFANAPAQSEDHRQRVIKPEQKEILLSRLSGRDPTKGRTTTVFNFSPPMGECRNYARQIYDVLVEADWDVKLEYGDSYAKRDFANFNGVYLLTAYDEVLPYKGTLLKEAFEAAGIPTIVDFGPVREDYVHLVVTNKQ